jgi:hypothetical protein
MTPAPTMAEINHLTYDKTLSDDDENMPWYLNYKNQMALLSVLILLILIWLW